MTRRADGGTVIAIRSRLRLSTRLAVTAVLGIPTFLLYKALTMQEWFAAIFVGTIEALFLLVAATTWVGSSRVTVDGETILVSHVPRLWFAGKHEIERKKLLAVRIVAMPEFGRQHYSLWLDSRGAKRICAAASVPTIEDAERLKAALEAALRNEGQKTERTGPATHG